MEDLLAQDIVANNESKRKMNLAASGRAENECHQCQERYRDVIL